MLTIKIKKRQWQMAYRPLGGSTSQTAATGALDKATRTIRLRYASHFRLEQNNPRYDTDDTNPMTSWRWWIIRQSTLPSVAINANISGPYVGSNTAVGGPEDSHYPHFEKMAKSVRVVRFWRFCFLMPPQHILRPWLFHVVTALQLPLSMTFFSPIPCYLRPRELADSFVTGCKPCYDHIFGNNDDQLHVLLSFFVRSAKAAIYNTGAHHSAGCAQLWNSEMLMKLRASSTFHFPLSTFPWPFKRCALYASTRIQRLAMMLTWVNINGQEAQTYHDSRARCPPLLVLGWESPGPRSESKQEDSDTIIDLTSIPSTVDAQSVIHDSDRNSDCDTEREADLALSDMPCFI